MLNVGLNTANSQVEKEEENNKSYPVLNNHSVYTPRWECPS